MGTASVIRANSRDLPLADNSVDLVVTSPPYFALRSYQDGGERYAGQIGDEPTPDEFVSSLLDVTRECMRVLRPSGSLWVNLGDKYAQSANQWGGSRRGHQGMLAGTKADDASRFGVALAEGAPSMGAARPKSLIGIPWRYALRCIDDLGLILRAEVIWSKPNGLPESVTDRVRRSHETWFHFTLQPRYFSAVDEIREQYEPDSAARRIKYGQATRGGGYATGDRNDAHRGGPMGFADASNANPLGKLPGSVWTVPTEPLRVPESLGIDHFAAFPTQWPLRIIKAWCPEGGSVLDPFGGTGTTAMVAKALGRHGISVDMSADYCRLAEWRTNDRDQLAKVLGVAKVEQQPEDQLSMFDLLDGEAS